MSQPEHATLMEILLVEDNPDDIVLTLEALQQGKVRNHLTVVEDGEAAMALLRREGRFAEAARPDLILLDLFLPRKHGWEVLAEIKQDPNLNSIPVVILAMSADSDHLPTTCYADGCLTKPVEADRFLKVVTGIKLLLL
jgi:two-component system, chemotaxis family, response regulator Rcp1